MPAIAYVRSMEMRRDVDTRYAFEGTRRRLSPECVLTFTVEIIGWEGGRPSVQLAMAGETIALQVSRMTTELAAPAKKQRKRKERSAPSCPIFPLRAPRDPSRWDYLEIDE